MDKEQAEGYAPDPSAQGLVCIDVSDGACPFVRDLSQEATTQGKEEPRTEAKGDEEHKDTGYHLQQGGDLPCRDPQQGAQVADQQKAGKEDYGEDQLHRREK